MDDSPMIAETQQAQTEHNKENASKNSNQDDFIFKKDKKSLSKEELEEMKRIQEARYKKRQEIAEARAKREEKRKKKEAKMANLSEFQKLLLSDSSDDDEYEEVIDEEELFEENDEYSDLVESNDLVSAVVGTSIKSSFRNFKYLLKIHSIRESDEEEDDEDEDDDDDETKDNESKKAKKKKKVAKIQVPIDNVEKLNTEMAGMTLTFQSDACHSDKTSDDYDFDNMNLAETMTVIEEDNDADLTPGEQAANRLKRQLNQTKLKRTVMTILLTQKWRLINKGKKKRKRRDKSVKYQPTYRMHPKININLIKYLIIKKANQTFESLVEKHGSYDTEYTPRFLRIITEMIKNDVKSFKLDRYKIVVHVTILKRVMNQSLQFISKCLFNYDDDHRIVLRADTKSFYAVCLIFLVYKE